MLFMEICVEEVYGRDGIKIMPGATVIDIGANVGMFALWAATRAPNVRVIAIEPSPRMCDFLGRNVKKNRAPVTIVQAACGGTDGRAILYSPGEETKNTLLSSPSGDSLRPIAEVDVMTLDTLFSGSDISVCDLLKLDCEGAEYDILLNTSAATYGKIRQISLEYHSDLEGGRRRRKLEELLVDDYGFGISRHPITEDMGYLYARRI